MLIGDNAFTEFKGAFTEQYVLQQLLAVGLKPYYWSNTKTPSEIDFRRLISSFKIAKGLYQ